MDEVLPLMLQVSYPVTLMANSFKNQVTWCSTYVSNVPFLLSLTYTGENLSAKEKIDNMYECAPNV